MSPEDVQRTVQFLLNQQAASEAKFDALMGQLSQRTDQVAQGLIGLTAIVGHVVDSVSTIAEGQRRTDDQLRQLAADHRLTEEHLRTVESHLNVVVDMFDRHLREDHGQRPS
jgi:hypothetical protein